MSRSNSPPQEELESEEEDEDSSIHDAYAERDTAAVKLSPRPPGLVIEGVDLLMQSTGPTSKSPRQTVPARKRFILLGCPGHDAPSVPRLLLFDPRGTRAHKAF